MSWHDLEIQLARVRPYREPLVMVVDALVVIACWHITYLFRLGFERWHVARPDYDTWVLLGLVAIYVLCFLAAAIPRGMWRFSGFGEIKRLTLACFSAGLLGAVVVLMAALVEVPRAVLALHPVVTLMGLSTVRILYRMLYEHMRCRITGAAKETRRALVLGAGDAARLLIAGIQHQGWMVVGCLDDDASRQGARLGGVTVLGTLDAAAAWAQDLDATHVVIALPSASTRQRRHAWDCAARTRLPVLTVPSARELSDGRTITHVRDIEPEDLLGRDPVTLDEAGISETLSGKVVLITGAGGSIGAELCRQVARFGPSKLVLFELNEFNLYTIEQELTERFPHLPLARLIGDVKQFPQILRACQRHKPSVVFHAAAYKHVPLMENDNAWAALSNNTLGTYQAALAAAQAGVDRFVLISTDKAVNPTNVMGATKRAAEMVISHLARQGHSTRFMAVRFGNVLGSSGSVIPKFKQQIAKGGPVTVTHPDITRYFMTIPEAARLVIQAAAIGETGQVFVLDMGNPVKIADLAREIIQLSGHSEDEIRIIYTGLRPGEKLFEELLADADSTVATAFAGLRIAKLESDGTGLEPLLKWVRSLDGGVIDEAKVKLRLRQLVTEYRIRSE